jgi:hypothetical protein
LHGANSKPGKAFVFLCTKTVDNFVHECPEWLLQPQCCSHFLILAQKMYCNKVLNKQRRIVSCNIAATSVPLEAANLLGLWIEMICQYAVWPILQKFSRVAERETRD